jgi:hypothetical protein
VARLCHCPSWDRTRTLLIQSQACCQLHQGADLPLRHADFRGPVRGTQLTPYTSQRATPLKSRKLWRHSPLRLARNPLSRGLLALTLATVATACRSSIDALGTTPATARHAADHLFAGFAYRFYDVRRNPDFERARTLMGQYALIPSRLFRDSTIWNHNRPDSGRALLVGATFADNHYTFAANPQAPPPRALGDQRHSLQLKWLGGGDYEWFTQVDHAVGSAKPAHIAAAVVATLTAGEDRAPDELLAESEALFPATALHLSQLFSIDSLRTRHDNGATATTLAVRFQPSRLRPRYSYFANFVDKYIMDAVYRVQLTDASGRQFFDATGRDGRLLMHVRSRDHKLVSFDASGSPMPDSLRLVVDVSMKYRMFRVGFSNLVGDFTIERSATRRAWMMRFRREPGWHFPLAVDKLIKNPLRRPFRGNGAELSLGFREDGNQTLSERHARFVVNESAIMRWLGRLGASAFGDFSGRTEAEENLFLYETFEALRKDVLNDK